MFLSAVGRSKVHMWDMNKINTKVKDSFEKVFFLLLWEPVQFTNCWNSWVATLSLHWKLRRIEEIRGITSIFEKICQNLAQNLKRIEEISHMYVLVDLTFTDVIGSNKTVYSRRNTMLTVGEKWTYNTKL